MFTSRAEDKREKAKLNSYRGAVGFLGQPAVITALTDLPAIPLAAEELAGRIELSEALDPE